MFDKLILAMNAIPYGPVTLAGTDANQALPANIVTNTSRNAIRVFVTCEAFPIRYGFGGVIPTNGTSGVGHILAVNESLMISHPSAISSFRFINHTIGSNASLRITGEYGA